MFFVDFYLKVIWLKKIIIQAFKFFGLSGLGWIIDMCIFSLLTYFSVYTILANIISSFVAVTFVYLTSTKNIFVNMNNKFNIKKKYVVYVLYQVIIVLISSTIINLIAKDLTGSNIELFVNYSKILAKIIVTPFTMVTNFMFMKFLVEKV